MESVSAAPARWWSEAGRRTQPLFACVSVPEFPAQALVRLRPALRGKCLAVLEGAPPHERVCAGNAQARRDGLRNGMTRVEAESFGGMVTLGRSPREEASAHAAMLSCVGGFTPMAEVCHTDAAGVCVLDAAGMGRLHATPQLFAGALRRALHGCGFYATVAISTNFDAARSLARTATPIAVVPPGEERQALAPLLLDGLDLSEAQRELLGLWGIGTLGGLAALPERELIARMGQEGKRLRELARGERPHLFAPAPLPLELKEELVFDSPVRVIDSLLFAVSPMLDGMLAQARERALAIAAVTVTLFLGARALDPEDDGRDGAARPAGKVHLLAPPASPAPGELSTDAPTHYCRTIRPSLPTGNKRLLLKLLQLDLAAHPPGSSVVSVVLEAAAAKQDAVQAGLFAPPLPEPSRLDVTLARLAALVGEGRVGSPVLRDTHAPDSFSVSLFKNEPAFAASETHTPALRRLRPPAPALVHTERAHPVRFSFCGALYQVRSACGPWRMSGAWWSPAAWAYECWDVVGETRAEARPALLPSMRGGTPEPPARVCCRLRRTVVPEPAQWSVEALYD